jgi:lysophospholipase L1-like esterase
MAAALVAAGFVALAPQLWADGPVAGDQRATDGGAQHSPPTAAPSQAGAPKKTRPYVVAAMGDSLTDPRSHGGKYLDVLRERCPKSRFDSYGVGGNMVNQMRKRFLRDVFGESGAERARDASKPSYTHLLMLGGINDICSDETAKRTNDKIKTDLSWMYAAARERGVNVVAMTLPPWAGFTRYYNPRRARSTFDMNDWIRACGPSGEVDAVFDVFPLLSCGDREHLCDAYGWSDKVHWSKAGHQVVGKALHSAIFADCE